MLEDKEMAFQRYEEYIDRTYGDAIPVDEKITNCPASACWLHFSDCMNNGGSSQLFLDFSPSEKGISGQVIRFIHDPDKLTVIADSFNKYLQMLIDNSFDYIDEDTAQE